MFTRCIVAAAAALITFGSAQAQQARWNLPSAYPPTISTAKTSSPSPRTSRTATGGKLQITVHAGASLSRRRKSSAPSGPGQAQAGEILISLHENEDPVFGIDVVPFLATSFDDARKLWIASRPAVEKKLADQGLIVLFSVAWPPQGIFVKKTSTRSPTSRARSGAPTTPATRASPNSSALSRSPSRRRNCRRRLPPASSTPS